MQQAALMTGLPKPILQASWYGIGRVIKTWVTEGHCVSLPGFWEICARSERGGLKIRRKHDSLITSRRVIFIPSVDIKRTLATLVTITCYNRKGEVVPIKA